MDTAVAAAATDILHEHVRLPVEGMTCATCAGRVERALTRRDGVRAAVNLAGEAAGSTTIRRGLVQVNWPVWSSRPATRYRASAGSSQSAA